MNKPPDKIAEVLFRCCHKNKVSYNGKIVRFKFDEKGDKNIIEEGATDFGITPSFYPDDECEIELNRKYNHDTVFFLNEKAFLNRIEEYQAEFDEMVFVIIEFQGDYIIKNKGETFSEEKAIFFNAVQYRNLIDFISHSSDFISFHDETEHRFLIFSTESGPFFIGYNKMEAKVKSLPDLGPLLENLKTAFSKIDFVQFFKAAVIQGIHATPEDSRFFEMVNSLQVLLDIAIRDHNIYLRQFGFEKIKAKFKEERVKYFDSIEKNIDAVSKQVTSFPLTFAASIFAGYQVKEKSFILFVILGAYFLYTVIAWKILDVVAFNRVKIEEDVTLEKNNIQNGYKVLYDDFKSDFDKIEDKISRLKTLIILLRVVLISLLLAFCAFCIYQNWFSKQSPPVPTEVRIVK